MIYAYKNIKTNKLIPSKEKIDLDYLKIVPSSLDKYNSFLKSSNFNLNINNSFLTINYNNKINLVFIETNIRIITLDINNIESVLLPRNKYIISFSLVSKDEIIYNYSFKNTSLD